MKYPLTNQKGHKNNDSLCCRIENRLMQCGQSPVVIFVLVGEPNNNDDEDCISIDSDAGNRWNDQKCSKTQSGFICMKQGKLYITVERMFFCHINIIRS